MSDETCWTPIRSAANDDAEARELFVECFAERGQGPHPEERADHVFESRTPSTLGKTPDRPIPANAYAVPFRSEHLQKLTVMLHEE